MTPLFVANWKMHGSRAFIGEWAAAAALPPDGCEVAVCPPLPYLAEARRALPSAFLLGAQTIASQRDDGAHTGEVSGRMLKDLGCAVAIVGHSERRAAQREQDSDCAAKVQAAAAAGLRPILCVGECAATRQKGGSAAAIAAVLAQLDAACARGTDDLWQRLAVAYEPVWAIGSGQTPSADDIRAMHGAIRQRLMQKTKAFGGRIAVLYGGSVSPENAGAFIRIENVNGFLVGGASLAPQTFNAICATAAPL